MADILVATDAGWIVDEVTAGVGGPELEVRSVSAGLDVLPAVLDCLPDLVVLDLQIGNMGGMAACLNLRLEEGAGRVGHVPVLMLLDRRADVFLARRSAADGWLIKPLDPIRLRRAVHVLLAGDTYFDPTDAPIARPAPLTLG
jgi:two-component system nitrate/nitrite response regulator NarL